MFKVIWDKEYNGVRLTMSSAGEALGTAPRPVFWEELDLLGLNKVGWIYPHVKEPLLWACDRRYFYKGEFVLEVKGGNIFDKPSVIQQEGYESLVLKPVDIEKLRSRNEDTMFIIEHEAMDFINQTYRRYKNIREVSKKNPDIDFQALANNLEKKTKEEHVVIKEDCDSFDVMPLSKAEELGKAPILSSKVDMFISSFSGGKDSMVVLDLVTRVIPSENLYVVYSNTGYELPTSLSLFDKVKEYYCSKYPTIQFLTAKNHQDVLYYWDEMDSPSRNIRWCCAVMKTAPLYRLLKTINNTGKQPVVMAFEGVRAEESEKRSQYSRIGKGVKHSTVLNVRPIFEWNVTEIWLYTLFNDLFINEAYRRGLSRVGCVICPLSSELGDCLDYQLFTESAQPFVDKLIENATKSGVKNVESYIKERKWKVRAGGDRHETESDVIISSVAPDFSAKVIKPKENIFEWLKTLGKSSFSVDGDVTSCVVKYTDSIYNVKVTQCGRGDEFSVSVENCGNNVFFVSHLKRVLYKSANCVHCEVCEVECPSGALSVIPRVKIDDSKCVKCHRCLDFIDRGCETANSIKKTIGIIKNKDKMNSKSPLNRYNTFGLREHWLNYYLSNIDEYFDSENHGLNVKKQLPVFKKWLQDADVLQTSCEKPTEIGSLFAKTYQTNKNLVWELMWIALTNNSELCSWYIETIGFSTSYYRDELDTLLKEAYPNYTDTTIENSMKAFQNTFKESPLGGDLGVGIVNKDKNKVSIIRMPYRNLSIVALAYSLYRYAERQQRYSLTVSEFYDENQKEGVYRQFGISKDSFERLLLSLQEESNHVLRAELRMGLDNIILRDDLNSIDILKMML